MKKILYVAAALAVAACNSNEPAYDATGVFELTELTLSAKAQGELIRLGIEEGEEIHQGDTLGLIDTRQLSLRRQQLEQSRQANDARQLSLSQQVASLKQQIANAKREKARFESMLQAGAATQKQVDDIAYQISVLEQQLSATSEQIKANNQSIASQGEAVGAQIAGVEEQMSDAVVLAPITGVVLAKLAQQGEYAVPGRPLLRVGNTEDIKLRAYVTAPQLTQLRLGQQVTVFADQGEADRKEYAGVISWISDEAEFTPKTIQTRDERANLVYAIKVSVKNDGLIKRGMYGEVKF